MPTRAAVAVVSTVIAVALLFSFKTPAQSPTRDAVVPTSSIAPASPPAVTASAGPGATPAGAPPTPTPASAFKSGTFTGDTATADQYGDVQVTVTISNGRITDVQAPVLPTDRQLSAEISRQAAPLLHDEVLTAQSANIDSLSGATYTSAAYQQSLQSALDRARA